MKVTGLPLGVPLSLAAGKVDTHTLAEATCRRILACSPAPLFPGSAVAYALLPFTSRTFALSHLGPLIRHPPLITGFADACLWDALATESPTHSVGPRTLRELHHEAWIKTRTLPLHRSRGAHGEGSSAPTMSTLLRLIGSDSLVYAAVPRQTVVSMTTEVPHEQRVLLLDFGIEQLLWHKGTGELLALAGPRAQQSISKFAPFCLVFVDGKAALASQNGREDIQALWCNDLLSMSLHTSSPENAESGRLYIQERAGPSRWLDYYDAQVSSLTFVGCAVSGYKVVSEVYRHTTPKYASCT